MSVNDDIQKAEEERIARLKNPLKPYGPRFTQLTPEQWTAITEETKAREEEKKNRPAPPTKGQMGADAVRAKKYEDALKRVSDVDNDGYLGLSNDLKGDILNAMGKKEDAKKAYQEALKRFGPKDPYAKFTQEKLESLGV